MPGILILDAEAVSALARRGERAASARRAQAVLVEAARRRALVRVPAAALAEVYRGGPGDAAIDHVLGRMAGVVTTGRRVARVAGTLLARDRLDSCHAVDAMVIATAIRLGGGVVLTRDVDDLRSLAADHANVVVLPLP